MSTFFITVFATLFTLFNWAIVLYWRDMQREAEWWVKYKRNYEREMMENMQPWRSGYLYGLRAGQDLFRKHFDRARRHDTRPENREHKCDWRSQMFAAKESIEYATYKAGPDVSNISTGEK